GWPDRCAPEPADEDDAVLHAGLHDALAAAVRVRPEPLLRREQHLQHPAAVPHRPAAAARPGEANVEEGGRGKEEGCSPIRSWPSRLLPADPRSRWSACRAWALSR